MKNWKWKKILSIVLAALLVVALLPNTVNASDTGISDDTTQIRTITLDEDGNIIASSDGTVTDGQTGSQDDQTTVIADTDQSDTNTQTDQTDDGQTKQAETDQTDSGVQADETNTDTNQTESDTSTGSTDESSSDDSGASEDGDSSETGSEASTDDAQDGTDSRNSDTTDSADAGEDEDSSDSGEVPSSENTQDGSDESNASTADEVNAGGEASGSGSENESSSNDAQEDADNDSKSEASGDDVESAESGSENTDNDSGANIDTDSGNAANSEKTSDSSTQSDVSDGSISVVDTYTTTQVNSASAVDVENKMLTVDANATDSESGDYTTIQDAIDYIYALDNSDNEDLKENWTIVVESGTYNQFAVLPGLDGLTVKAADNATVTVNTWTGADNASARAVYPSGGEFKDSFNSILIAANNVTIEGLNIVVGDTGIKADSSGTETAPWYSAGITDLGNNYIPSYPSDYDGLTIQNCTFTTTVGACSGVLLASAENWTVSNCEFDGFAIAVYALGDNSVAENVSITDNIFNNCEQAAYIYYGGTPADDANYSLNFTGNTLKGTADQYCMVTFVDLYGNNGSIDNLTVTGNSLTYSIVALVDVGGDEMDILETNTCDQYSFYVYSEDETGITDKSGKAFTFTYVSSGDGYWTLNSDSFSSLNNLADETSAESSVLEAIYAANIGDSVNTVSVTVTITSYAKTFLEPNAIEWNLGSLPEVDKTIVTTVTEEDGSEAKSESTQADAAAGDTVSYKLTSVVPSTLSNYIDYDDASSEEESTDDDVTEQTDEESTIFVPRGTVQTVTTNEEGIETTSNKVYAFSFVDEMDSDLVPNADSVVVLIGDETLNVDYYTVTVTESTIETTETDDFGNVITKNIYVLTVTIDLLKLYAEGIITENDFGKTEITVTYTATLSENATAGSYSNTAYVTFPEGYSKESETEVNSYSLRIYKYDLSTLNRDEDENAVPSANNSTPLANAVFYLCNEDGEKVSNALVTDKNGIAEFTATGLSGTYYLVEIAAPTGYVSVAENATTVITISVDNVDDDGVYTVQVANAAIPQTGGVGTQPFTVAGIAILLLAGLAYVVTRRRVY